MGGLAEVPKSAGLNLRDTSVVRGLMAQGREPSFLIWDRLDPPDVPPATISIYIPGKGQEESQTQRISVKDARRLGKIKEELRFQINKPRAL